MRHLKRMVLPVQIIALFVLPMIMITIITATLAGCLSLLTHLTFSDVTSSTPMWVFNFFTGIAFFVAVGQWMWEEK
jgi:hypothetical protein